MTKKRVTKVCVLCTTSYDVVQSYADKTKFCSRKCFLTSRKSRQPPVTKQCEGCKRDFVVAFAKQKTRFCSRRCAHSGVNNGMYGKPGTMCGRKAWNNGLSAMTDERVAALGRKISKIAKEQFERGERSHVGERNPMYGHTSDMSTPEQRERYSRAAVRRVLAGVSGYKTGHLTGTYTCLKSSPVRFKSSWELVAMMWWDKRDDVVSYRYEPEVIELDDGRRAIPDFEVVYADHKASYVEVKPTALAMLPVVADRLASVKARVEGRGKSYEVFGNVEFDRAKRELGVELKDEIERRQGGCTNVRDRQPV